MNNHENTFLPLPIQSYILKSVLFFMDWWSLFILCDYEQYSIILKYTFLNVGITFKNALKGFRTPDLKLTKLALYH